jgi:hypothetical protein
MLLILKIRYIYLTLDWSEQRRQVGPKDASWPMHSCGSTAVNGCSWPNFWANVAPFSLQARVTRSVEPSSATGRVAYDAFGVFGTALQENIGVFHTSSLRNGAENPKRIVPGERFCTAASSCRRLRA